MDDFREFWKDPNRKDGLTVCRASSHTSIVELEYISQLLIEWVDKEDEITVEAFYVNKNVPPRTWYDWLKRSELLQDAWDIALERIGERRERRALEGRYNPAFVLGTKALYSKSYRAYKLQERKSTDENTKQTIVVLRDKMPETDEVQPKGYESSD